MKSNIRARVGLYDTKHQGQSLAIRHQTSGPGLGYMTPNIRARVGLLDTKHQPGQGWAI